MLLHAKAHTHMVLDEAQSSSLGLCLLYYSGAEVRWKRVTFTALQGGSHNRHTYIHEDWSSSALQLSAKVDRELQYF